jgi:hypothetical protein
MAARGARLGDINRLPPSTMLARPRRSNLRIRSASAGAVKRDGVRRRLSDGDRDAILDGDAAKPFNLR